MGGTDYEDIRITTDMDADGGQLKDGKPVFEEVRCPECGVARARSPCLYDRVTIWQDGTTQKKYEKRGKTVSPMSELGTTNQAGSPLDINMGRLPILVTPAGAVGQSAGINTVRAARGS
jgi:hypothetical protein